jgi:3-deoxy-manno-octulosonate cytidylyltransferase (CMP-KDO synthetase)
VADLRLTGSALGLAVHPTEAEPETRRTAGPIVGAIPARYGSTRLPGKVLMPIAGRPMIEHVWRRASEADGLERVVVLTDDPRIAEAAAGFGAECEMTPADCASGTDRIAWAARSWQAAAVINIQGDEPLIEPQAIAALARHLSDSPDDPVATLAAPAEDGDLENPDVVKVVTDRRGYALYFSRASIPYPRGTDGATARRHVGIYGYQREALLRLAALEPTPLERSESLEQLRALENGISIRVLEVERAWWGVDTIEDLQAADRFLRETRQENRAEGP